MFQVAYISLLVVSKLILGGFWETSWNMSFGLFLLTCDFIIIFFLFSTGVNYPLRVLGVQVHFYWSGGGGRGGRKKKKK